MSSEFSWYQNLDQHDDFWVESAKLDFAVAMERMMQKSNITKSDLARKIDSSPAYITQVLRGDSNVTIQTMVKLARAVDGDLHLHISPRNHGVRWFEKIEGSKSAMVSPSDVALAAWKNPSKRFSHEQASFAA